MAASSKTPSRSAGLEMATVAPNDPANISVMNPLHAFYQMRHPATLRASHYRQILLVRYP